MVKRNQILILLIFTVLIIIFFSYSNPREPELISNSSSINNGVKVVGLNNLIDFQKLDTKDNFIILNIWASWCVPCQNEVSHLKEISRTEGYTVIGILVQDSIINGEIFIKDNNITFQNILDPDYSELIISQFYWSGIPTTILLNEDYEVIQTFNGEITYSEIINFSN